MRQLALALLALVLAGGALASCSTPQQNPTPTATPAVTRNPTPTPTASLIIPSPTQTPTVVLTATPTPRVGPTSTPSPTPTPNVMIPIAKGTVWTVREDFPENPNQSVVLTERVWDSLVEIMFETIQPDPWYLYPSEKGKFGGAGLAHVIADGEVWFATWLDLTCVKNCNQLSGKELVAGEAGPAFRDAYRLFYSLEAGKAESWVELPPPAEYSLSNNSRLTLRGFYGRDGIRVFNEGDHARFVIFATRGDKPLGNTGTIYETAVVKP